MNFHYVLMDVHLDVCSWVGAAGLAALVKALGVKGVAPKLQRLSLVANDFSGAGTSP